MDADLKRSALILTDTSVPCEINQCELLASKLQKDFRFRYLQEFHVSSLPRAVRVVPDMVVLRLSGTSFINGVIHDLKAKWAQAPIFALLCPAPNDSKNDRLRSLNVVDDFICCPYNNSELFFRIQRLLGSQRADQQPDSADLNKENFIDSPLVGASPVFSRVIEKIPLIANVGLSVLVSGETGSGKEVIARAIHYRGRRRGKPFIPVNCGALPDHLFENELFGHAKGAFTDASSAEKGLIAEAEGGTLFLDEIDALSRSAQVKLLRFLQNGEYRPVGSSRSVHADVRVITATNANLLERIKAKEFREDLYYRINALQLTIPPLRERADDIARLANYFIIQYAREHSQKPRRIADHALRALMAYRWPGNVRELESVILRALVLTSSETLQPADFALPCDEAEAAETLSASAPLREAKRGVVQAFERSYLTNLLVAHRGNITQAAKAAGKQRRALQRLLQKYRLDRNTFYS